jgi:predicted ribosomally synthesized peptide with nif11-like leader
MSSQQEDRMSKEIALSFIGKVNEDQTMQEQIKGLNGIADLLAFAEKAGYRFTTEEWNETVTEIGLQMADELNDKELEAVAGGAEATSSSFGWSAKFLPGRLAYWH